MLCACGVRNSKGSTDWLSGELSPPARDLYPVANGIPTDPVRIALLDCVLSEKGQSKNVPAGYIGMSQEKIGHSMKLLHPCAAAEDAE